MWFHSNLHRNVLSNWTKNNITVILKASDLQQGINQMCKCGYVHLKVILFNKSNKYSGFFTEEYENIKYKCTKKTRKTNWRWKNRPRHTDIIDRMNHVWFSLIGYCSILETHNSKNKHLKIRRKTKLTVTNERIRVKRSAHGSRSTTCFDITSSACKKQLLVTPPRPRDSPSESPQCVVKL